MYGSGSHPQLIVNLSLQECTQQKPKDPEFWSLLSKAMSDMTYLDEIPGPHREKLTDDDKRRFNTQAMEHAKKVTAQKMSSLEAMLLACSPHIYKVPAVRGCASGSQSRSQLVSEGSTSLDGQPTGIIASAHRQVSNACSTVDALCSVSSMGIVLSNGESF